MNQSLEPKQRKGSASNFIKYTVWQALMQRVKQVHQDAHARKCAVLCPRSATQPLHAATHTQSPQMPEQSSGSGEARCRWRIACLRVPHRSLSPSETKSPAPEHRVMALAAGSSPRPLPLLPCSGQGPAEAASQDHRIVGVGRDLERPWGPTPQPKQVPWSKLPRWASRRVMNIPREGDPTRLRAFPDASPAACSRTQQHPTFSFALHLPPRGSKKTNQPNKKLLLSPQSRSRTSPFLLLAGARSGAEQGTSSLWRPRRRLPAPRPPAPLGRAGPVEKNLVK